MPTIHDRLTIIDGLLFWSDGTTETLRQGNVAAANVTVCGFQSDFATACDDIARWHGVLSRPDSPWHLVLKADDIDEAQRSGKIGLIMGFQNLIPIDHQLDRLAFFHACGVRVMQLTYNERNFVGDGCMEEHQTGLSAFGKRVIDELNRLRIAIDLSHVSERTCQDVLERSTAPVLVTHSNAKAVLDVPRNKSDDLLKKVAEGGGTVGASIHGFLCWDGNPDRRHTLSDYVTHIKHMRDLVGIDAIAMGTDFPAIAPGNELTDVMSVASRYPSVTAPYVAAFGNAVSSRYPEDCGSPAELARLTDALLAEGWSEDDLEKFYSRNLRRALHSIWAGD